MPDDDVKVLFGRRVRQLRTERGVSQEAFAHQIQIDRSYFGSIERGERNVSLENICLIAAGLGVEPAELLRFDTPPDAARLPANSPTKGSPPRPQGQNRRRTHE
jgi:transcriptional regulator with XRE-family HTH domain